MLTLLATAAAHHQQPEQAEVRPRSLGIQVKAPLLDLGLLDREVEPRLHLAQGTIFWLRARVPLEQSRHWLTCQQKGRGRPRVRACGAATRQRAPPTEASSIQEQGHAYLLAYLGTMGRESTLGHGHMPSDPCAPSVACGVLTSTDGLLRARPHSTAHGRLFDPCVLADEAHHLAQRES